MTDIRDNAIHCEVRKIAYRQSKDGVVVSFVIHPNEVPQTLATAELGSRYMLALVELGDDEKPKVHEGEAHGPSTLAATRSTSASESGRGQPSPVRKPIAPEKKLTQQAGICCGDPMFRRFLYEKSYAPSMTEQDAIDYVHAHCQVTSRRHISPDNPAGLAWRDLHADFEAWKLL